MADTNKRLEWTDEDTYWRTNYRNRPVRLIGGPGVPTITSRVIDTATKPRIDIRIAAGTTSNPTCPGTGARTSTAAARRGSR